MKVEYPKETSKAQGEQEGVLLLTLLSVDRKCRQLVDVVRREISGVKVRVVQHGWLRWSVQREMWRYRG